MLCLAAIAALPPAAGAVLSGTNGRIAFIQGPAFGNTQLFLRTVTSSTGAGSISGPLNTGLTLQHRHPTWSPDRTKLAFAEGPGGATGYDIYILDLTTPGATPQNITNSNNVTDDRPAWSPDGTRIAYESGSDIIVHPLSGGGDLNLTSTLTPKAWKAAWSPDSQTLYYSVGDISQPPNGTNNDIRLYQQPANNSSAGTELLHVSGAHVFQPSISPDGTKLCYTLSPEAGNSKKAAVVAAPLSAPGSITVIADGANITGDYNCTWSPDGTKIAYTDDYAANGEIYMRNSDATGIPIDLTNSAGVFDGNADWAPDGRPQCRDTTVTTYAGFPVSIPLPCADTGPAYEQTSVRALTLDGSGPTQGSVSTTDPQTLPASITYTPNPGFTGTDSFKVRSFDEVAFGDRDGTLTVQVVPAPVCAGKASTIVGTAGPDVLTGTPGPDVISGLGGNDRISGLGGGDVICGNEGNDILTGARGKDTLIGGSGNDKINGGAAKDKLKGEAGNDVLKGGPARDVLKGGPGNDFLLGQGGSDLLVGQGGRDTCFGGGGGSDRGRTCERLKGI